MASGPLHWFRKNQKLMLAFFGIGLMIVFTLQPLFDWLGGGRGPSGSTRSVESVAVEWQGGELREEQLTRLRTGRMLLGQFLGTVRQLAVQRGGVPNVAMLPLYTSDQSLLELELLAAEAGKLGIEVGDEAVLDYLNQLTGGTVDASEYRSLVRTSTRSNLSEPQLLDLMTHELTAYKALTMIQSGGYPASPIASWDYYNRLNRFVKAEIMPISVDDYLDKVEEPSDVEIAELYAEHKDDYPFPLSPEPGFRRRERRAFQYVKVNFDAILDVEKAAVTDEEVKQYYEENKEQFRNDLGGDFGLEMDDAAAAGDDNAVEAEEAETAAVEDAESSTDGEATSSAVEDDGDAESQETPTETESPQPDSDPNPSPTALPQEDDVASPQDEVDDEQPVAESADEAVTEDTDAATTTDDLDTLITDANTDGAEAEVTTDAEIAADADEEPAVEASDVEAVETATESTATEETIEPAAAGTSLEPSDLDPVEPTYETIEDVADDIRRSIARPRAQEKMNTIINEVKREITRFETEYEIRKLSDEAKLENDFEEEGPDLKAFVDGERVVVGEVPLIDPLQANEFELGRAFDIYMPEGGNVQQVMFAQTAFSDSVSMFSPRVIPEFDMMATDRFVYWMTDVKEEYVPELDEARSEVVKALKRQRAVVLALEDAKTLAEKARQQDTQLAVSLSDRENPEFIDTGEISWWTPPMMEGSTPRMSAIPGADDAGTDLREALFRLAPGEVGFATNLPKNKVYLFRVEGVNPTDEQRREQFLRRGAEANVRFLARRDSLTGISEWYRDLTEQYDVQWQRDPISDGGS